jgi:hypothetical protein
MQNEKRKHPRVKLKYKITIICKGKVLFGSPEDYVFHTFSENLSEDGVMVKLERQLSNAAIVRLNLFVTEKAPFDCKGSIAWTKKVNPENTKPDIFETGIRFIELDYAEQEIIANLVKSFIKTQ